MRWEVAGVLGGLVATYLLGTGVCCALKSVTVSVPPPSDEQIKLEGRVGGRLLGVLEQTLFFASLWVEAYTLIGVWLAFKVASKWQAWQTVVRVPEDFGGNDPPERLRVRHAWGSRLASRFLIGSLYNILCAFGGVAAGKVILRLLTDP